MCDGLLVNEKEEKIHKFVTKFLVIYFFAGSNSSALSSNVSSLTSNNGVGNQMAPTNVTNTSSNPAALNSTHASTTHGLTTKTTERIPTTAGKGSSVRITSRKDKNSVTKEPESTKPVVTVVSSTANQINEGNVFSSRKYPDQSQRWSLEIPGSQRRNILRKKSNKPSVVGVDGFLLV